MRILIGDDDLFFRKVVGEILSEAGHDVVVATSGEEVIEKAMDRPPDLIILDVILPGLLGTEVSRKLRHYTRTAAIPILLTSVGIAEIESAGGDPKEFLADDFIQKPFTPEKLLDRVDRLTCSTSPFASMAQTNSVETAKDRRKNPRVPIDVEVTLRTAEVLLYHPMINISTGGIYLEVDRPLPREAVLDLNFPMPDTREQVRAEGQVAWSVEIEEGRRWAIGIRFISISQQVQQQIQGYVETLMKVVQPSGGGDNSSGPGKGAQDDEDS